jgi:hypothetical protein
VPTYFPRSLLHSFIPSTLGSIVSSLDSYRYFDYYSTMRFLYSILPLLAAVTFASELVTKEECQCPQVKCPADDAVVSTPTLPNQINWTR